MKGNEKIIESLNVRLVEELTAVNQYFVHAEMCENRNYKLLGEAIEQRSIIEMRHAEKLIERILFLEGKPIVSKLNKITTGYHVPEMHEHDLEAELGAVKGYNESIRLAMELGDNNNKTFLESILKEEEENVDWLETQLDQIEQIGIQTYLAQQIYG